MPIVFMRNGIQQNLRRLYYIIIQVSIQTIFWTYLLASIFIRKVKKIKQNTRGIEIIYNCLHNTIHVFYITYYFMFISDTRNLHVLDVSHILHGYTILLREEYFGYFRDIESLPNLLLLDEINWGQMQRYYIFLVFLRCEMYTPLIFQFLLFVYFQTMIDTPMLDQSAVDIFSVYMFSPPCCKVNYPFKMHFNIFFVLMCMLNASPECTVCHSILYSQPNNF